MRTLITVVGGEIIVVGGKIIKLGEGEGFNRASVLCPIPFHVNETKYV